MMQIFWWLIASPFVVSLILWALLFSLFAVHRTYKSKDNIYGAVSSSVACFLGFV